ncbi:alpha-L-arabinofuranosidase [Bradyrhizobium sp. USDA 4474]
MSVEARRFGRMKVSERVELRHDDLRATNTKHAPDTIKPAPLQNVTFDGGRLQATLEPASWNVIHLSAS